jgi:hypothetical protein
MLMMYLSETIGLIFSLLIPLVIPFTLGFTFGKCAKNLKKFFFKIFNQETSKEIKKAIYYTRNSAMCLGGASIFPVQLCYLLTFIKPFDIYDVIYPSIVPIVPFILFTLFSIYSERKARELVKKAEGTLKQKESNKV